jgi:hypothetical protein
VIEKKKSGREVSNLRPLGPEPSALARLSHAPLLKLVNLRGNLIYKKIFHEDAGWLKR